MQGGNDVDNTLVYQRVANAADAPLSGAPQGGGYIPAARITVYI